MQCECGGVVEQGSCGDCGKRGLPSAADLIRILRAHRRAGNLDVLRDIQDEIGEPAEVVIEKMVPVETIVYKEIAELKTPVNNWKQGRPALVTIDTLIRVRSMMLVGIALKECAKSLGITERTLLVYVSPDGTFKAPALKRMSGQKRCVPPKAWEKARANANKESAV